MKRSEMLEIIQKALEVSGDGYYSDTKENVLTAIEEAGIMPPITILEKNENYKIYTTEWEKE